MDLHDIEIISIFRLNRFLIYRQNQLKKGGGGRISRATVIINCKCGKLMISDTYMYLQIEKGHELCART